jgi:2-dehydro-3-deoxygluconokinase
MSMGKIVTFGEIMLRLSPPGFLRFKQANSFDVTFGGGEANVAASLANFGLETEYVTRIPSNEIGEMCLQFLDKHKIGTHHIIRGGDRLGIYFLENGSNMRGSLVVYDRAFSSFSTLKPGMVDWESVFTGARWFHWTGITPAVSEGAAAVCLEGVQAARKMGITLSCDMNYRAKLWKWGKPAGEVMRGLLPYCDIVIGNEEDAEKVFGIHAPASDVTAGKIDAKSYQYVCEELVRAFPNIKKVAITLRTSISANHNLWSGILWDGGQTYTGCVYDITDIVDRVGGGDSFMGGLIYGLLKYPEDNQRALDFAVAASALKHTILGDFNLISKEEVEKLAMGDVSGRVSR